MGRYIATQTAHLLSKKGIATSKAKIAILGFSFKENIPDCRNTKVIQIINELKNWKANVEVFDPHVSISKVRDDYGITIKKLKDLKKQKFDAIILAVSHNEFFKKLSYYNFFYKNKNKKIMIDIKNVFHEDELIKNKYDYFQL
jgi:UDP-N-acetyl-D-galactosamine dehydrogenase